jgi:hypothetical protein
MKLRPLLSVLLCALAGMACGPDQARYRDDGLALVGRYAQAAARSCRAKTYLVVMPRMLGGDQMRLNGAYFTGYELEVCGERLKLPMECWSDDNTADEKPLCHVVGKPRVDQSYGSYEGALLNAVRSAPGFSDACVSSAFIAIEVWLAAPRRALVQGCGRRIELEILCEPLGSTDWSCRAEQL